jgi:hypothetical protein
MLHAVQIVTMSSCSPHSSSGSSSHDDSLQQLENNIIKEQEDTLSHPKDILSQPEDALPLHETTLSHLADILSQPKDSTMTGSDRSKHRNVHIFNASDRNTTIGGLILTEKNDDTNCVTNANFFAMVEIITSPTSTFTLRNESDIIIEKDNSPLQPGNYYIHCSGKLFLSSFIHK